MASARRSSGRRTTQPATDAASSSSSTSGRGSWSEAARHGRLRRAVGRPGGGSCRSPVVSASRRISGAHSDAVPRGGTRDISSRMAILDSLITLGSPRQRELILELLAWRWWCYSLALCRPLLARVVRLRRSICHLCQAGKSDGRRAMKPIPFTVPEWKQVEGAQEWFPGRAVLHVMVTKPPAVTSASPCGRPGRWSRGSFRSGAHAPPR